MKLSVIIVNYNHKKYLEDCLNSLFGGLKKIKAEILVIDNRSIDSSIDFLKKIKNKKINSLRSFFPSEIKIIFNKKNLGFAKACNKGIRKARGEYILLLNPDTQVVGESIKLMMDFLEKRKDITCVVPKLLNPDKTLQYSIRRFPGVLTVLLRRTPLRWTNLLRKRDDFHLMKDINHNRTKKIDWALGSCLMTRRNIFDQVGLFDEHFFVYCEDIDWFYRLKKARLKAYYLPKAKVIHHHLAISDKKLLSKESFYHTKSMIYFFKKYWREIVTFKYP